MALTRRQKTIIVILKTVINKRPGRHIIVISLLFISGLPFAKSQTIAETYQYCKAQYQEQQYQNAIESGRRVLFFDDSNVFKKEVTKILGKAYFQNGEYQKSAKYYDISYEYASGNDSTPHQLIMKKAMALLMNGTLQLAKAELLTLPPDLNPREERQQHLLLGITAFQRASFPKAKQYFKKAVPDSDSSRVNKLFRKNKALKRYDSWLPRIMSLVIPGSGQMVLGDFKNGINSLLLTGAIYTLFINTAQAYSYLEAIAGIFPTFQRYYVGGYQKVKDIQMQKKAKERHHIYQDLINLYYDSKP